MLTTERLCSLDSMWNCYAHVPVHSHMSVFPCPQWYFVRHLHQCICQGSVFPSVLLCSIMHMQQCMLGASISTVSLCSQWSSVVHMHMDASCIRCSSLLPSSIAGLFPHTLSWFHSIYYTSVTGALVPLLCGGSWLGCQDWLAMGAVSSRSWLPIVEAPRYLEHSSSM